MLNMINSVNSVNICGFAQIEQAITDIMQTKAEVKLNPLKYLLSPEAKKRLKWMYIIKYECNGKISVAAKKVGVSRSWLSQIHTFWITNHEDPRSLEPESKAPHNTDKRATIDQEIQDKIVEIRKKYQTWGKEKIAGCLDNQYQLKVGASTVNRYLHKNKLINLKLSDKNKTAWRNKQESTKQTKFRMRPPKEIKDYKPGALIEKDMKLILKPGQFIDPTKFRSKENFHYQHTFIDSFTRIRLIGLSKDSDSQSATVVMTESTNRLPFTIACINNDNGGENRGNFEDRLEQDKVFQFFSRTGTPTDNPRVERSHLTDDIEFYNQGNIHGDFEKQKQACLEWERIYNYERPHQALGQLTPMQFYELWKKDPDKAFAITKKYQVYLKRQKMKQANSRRMRKKEQIEKLMLEIDQKVIKYPNKKVLTMLVD
jgi:transposase InsO family protein